MKLTKKQIVQIIKEEIDAVVNEDLEANEDGARILSLAFQEMEDYCMQAIKEIMMALDKIHGEITVDQAVKLVMDGAEGEDKGGLARLLQDGIESIERDMPDFEDLFEPGLVDDVLDLGYEFAMRPPNEKMQLIKDLMKIMTAIKKFVQALRTGVDFGIYKIDSSPT